MARVTATLPDHTRLTLTWDQGSEIARHDQIADHSAKESSSHTPGGRGSTARTRTLEPARHKGVKIQPAVLT